jgi:hypothetical protein
VVFLPVVYCGYEIVDGYSDLGYNQFLMNFWV